MKFFPIGSSYLFKTGVLWGIVFGVTMLGMAILSATLGTDTMEQCGQDFIGEITVDNCADYETFSAIFMVPVSLITLPAIVYSVLGFKEFKKKKTLTVVMGGHGSKNYMKLERLLKIVNKNPSTEKLQELKNDLFSACLPLMSYVTDNNGHQLSITQEDMMNVNTLNHIYNTIASSVEPAAAAHDETMRIQKMQLKASQNQAAAARSYENSANMQARNNGSNAKGSKAGSVAKGVGTFMLGGSRNTYYCRNCGSVRSAKSLESKMCCGMNMKKQK